MGEKWIFFIGDRVVPGSIESHRSFLQCYIEFFEQVNKATK